PESQPDEYSRFAAAWALARFGWPSEDLKSVTERRGPYSLPALYIAVRTLGLRNAKDWCVSLLDKASTLRLGIIGIAAIGDPELADHLIIMMKHKEIARLAAEAFSTITGVDFPTASLEEQQTEPGRRRSENPECEDVSPNVNEDLPSPCSERVQKWWADHRVSFSPGVRYFRGQEMTLMLLKPVL